MEGKTLHSSISGQIEIFEIRKKLCIIINDTGLNFKEVARLKVPSKQQRSDPSELSQKKRLMHSHVSLRIKIFLNQEQIIIVSFVLS